MNKVMYSLIIYMIHMLAQRHDIVNSKMKKAKQKIKMDFSSVFN